MSERKAELPELRRRLIDIESTIIDLNRKLTEAIVAKRPTGGIGVTLDTVIEARNMLRDSMKRREAAIDGGRQEQSH